MDGQSAIPLRLGGASPVPLPDLAQTPPEETTGLRDNRTTGRCGQWSVVSGQWSVVSGRWSLLFLLGCLAVAWLPTRLIQEANPESRLISWALALEVVGLTLLVLRGWEQRAGSGEQATPGPRIAGQQDAGPEGRVGTTGELVRGQGSGVRGQTSEFSEAMDHGTTDHQTTRRKDLPLLGERAGVREDQPISVAGIRSQKSVGYARISGFGFLSDFGFRIPDFVFPLLFFLVAVPWPTLIEGPLIQFLTRANAAATVEIVTAIGLPALQRGNVIEVGTGIVGIDDACSGIRSFQATLMIALFLGGLYRLAWPRRLLLVLGGSLLAGAFNVARTSVLVWVASDGGMAAMSAWHDPTGVIILVADFICLWMAAMALRQRVGTGSRERGAGNRGAGSGDGRSETGDGRRETSNIEHRTSNVQQPATRNPQPATRFHLPSSIFSLRSPFGALAVWLLLAEVGTEVWYRSHEAHLPRTVAWKVELPQRDPTFRPLPFSDVTKQYLRYDEGVDGAWIEAAGRKLQAIFLRWNPGRTAPHLAKNHTPEVCLTAAGHELLSQTDLRLFGVRGLQLPFRSYVLRDEHGPVYVFYWLWEDRADAQFFQTQNLTYAHRLEPVLAGRRNSGQRSLEIAIWGLDDAQEADAALARELERLIRTGK